MAPYERAALPDAEELTAAEAADFLGVSTSFLNKLRVTGGGPVYAKVHAHRVTYAVRDLREYREARRSRSTSSPRAAA